MPEKQTQTTFGKPEEEKVEKGTFRFHPVKKKTFEGIIEELETVHNRDRFYALFSGGKDSMTVAHKLSEMGKLESILYIKTNIGLSVTTDFVEDICQEYGWHLEIREPAPKFIYADYVLQYGFPGPGFHKQIMGRLKYSTMRRFAFSVDKKRHCLISGVRKFESQRRMGNYKHPILNDGLLWFGSPIFYLSSEETYRYVHENNLKISPAYNLGLSTSGECMCGSFAVKGEKMTIKEIDPKLAEYIEWLEDGIQKVGTPMARRFSKWGGQAKMSELEQQQQMNQFFEENSELRGTEEVESVVCGEECGAGTMRGMMDY